MKTLSKIILFLGSILAPLLSSFLISAIWTDHVVRTTTAKGYSDQNDLDTATRDAAQVVTPVFWIGFGISMAIGAFLLINLVIKRKRNSN